MDLVRLFLDSFLGRLFLLDTSAAEPDTELDFFLGVALPAPGGVEPVPAGHYNAILKLELPSLATLIASTKAIIIIIITFYHGSIFVRGRGERKDKIQKF